MSFAICVCALSAVMLMMGSVTTSPVFDPCHTYTELNDNWRDTTNQDQTSGRLKCDKSVQWQGWYRMFHQGASVLMPNVCVPVRRCGTHAPLWMNGSHPLPEDGIVTRSVCSHWHSNCCRWPSPPIQVKACPGSYTVYKLATPPYCKLAYCTAASSVPADVTQVIVTTRSDTHIELEWTKVNDINTYILKSSDGTETPITGSAGNKVTHTVSPLFAGTEYSFTLFTVFEYVKSRGYVVSAATGPAAVTQVNVITRSTTHIELEWTKVNDTNTYILKSSDGTETPITGSAGNKVTHTVSSLFVGTEYSFTLFTVIEEWRSRGYVFSAVTVPAAVTQVIVTTRSDTHIELEWTKVNDINTYILKSSDGTETPITGSAGNKVTHTVSPLFAGTEYSFTLFTVFEYVKSRGYVFSAATGPAAVTQVNVITRSTTHIELEWTKVNDTNTYILKSSDGTETPITGSAGNKVTHTVSSLFAGTEYSFTLFTVIEEWRSRGYVFSAVTVPAAVTQVIVTTRSDTHIELEWTKVNDINTYILKSSDGTETPITGSAGNKVTHTVSPLFAGTEYSFTLFTVIEEVRSTGYVFSAVTDLYWATCSASGDPHYTSFDRRTYDFQGTCRYVLASVCNGTQGLPHFQVEARNEAWNGLQVSITVAVYVNVSGHLVYISKDNQATVQVNGETRNLPVLLDGGKVSVYANGLHTFLKTDFGLTVSYDGHWVLDITVPVNYTGATCGLCGNFNGLQGDDLTIEEEGSGYVEVPASDFGDHWKVDDGMPCTGGCGNSCPVCQDDSGARVQCELLRASNGPLSFCHAHVDPQSFFNNCVFDVCLSRGRNEVVCRAMEAYVSACQTANATIYPWRQISTCQMDCPENSHYDLCGTECGHTCASSIDASCDGTCAEGCFCDAGFVRSVGRCVPVEQCGCLYDGFYFEIGEQFWTQTCSQRCECFAPNDLRCTDLSCPPTLCSVRDGIRGCDRLSTCTVWGDPHYLTFDGALAHFQDTCAYEITHTCGNIPDDALDFRVVAANNHRGNLMVSFVSTVDVWLSRGGVQSHITIGQNRRVKVDGQDNNANTIQVGSLAQLTRESGFVVVNASGELVVKFDGRSRLVVGLSPNYNQSVCGMCGNRNNNLADDKALPNGTLAQTDRQFGQSWKSNASSPGCGASDWIEDGTCLFRAEYTDLCSIITNSSGPLQQCHQYVDPQAYLTSCVYDLCAYTPANGMLCSAVEAYEEACTVLGLQTTEWRSALHCSVADPCEELDCNEDEWCGKKGGIYGCFCNEDHPRPYAESFDSLEECSSSTGTMSLSRCQLFEEGFSAVTLHLNDPSCNGTLQDGRVEFLFDNENHICGTTLRSNGTHFMYENIIQGEANSAGGPISRESQIQLLFGCAYPLTQALSMDMEINPLESVLTKKLPGGQGTYRVRMIPYEDAGFSNAFSGNVSLAVNQRMYVAVNVEGVDSRQIAIVMDSCWATPVNQADYRIRWDLISNECPNPNDRTVQLHQNGNSTSGHFSFKMFFFTANTSKVYLHCSIHLCLVAGNDCTAHCYPGYPPRKRRSVDFHDSASLSLGPLVWARDRADG